MTLAPIMTSSPMALNRLFDVLERMLDDMSSTTLAANAGNGRGQQGVAYAPVNIEKTDEGYKYTFLAPGFSPDDVQVEVAGGVLKVVAEHKEAQEKDEGRYLVRQFALRNWQASISLPDDADADSVEAEMGNGLLVVRAQFKKEAKPKKLKILPIGKGK